MHLRPFGDRIVVTPVEAKSTSTGGIILPDCAKEKSQCAKVLAVGPGKLLDNGKLAEIAIKVGDVVVLSKYGGTEIKLGEIEYMIIRSDDILCVVENTEDGLDEVNEN
jgi:chaperonin GroES